ncbi:ATP-dependent DNA helicase [Trichonephila clavipes]|nr:ATP-dependent DNA helicase [Trichonephila clavipes]
MPPHIQHLKFCVPTIISQNINQPELCNGMRLAVQKLMSNIIEATILTGPFNDEDALIPRIPMIPTVGFLAHGLRGVFLMAINGRMMSDERP